MDIDLTKVCEEVTRILETGRRTYPWKDIERKARGKIAKGGGESEMLLWRLIGIIARHPENGNWKEDLQDVSDDFFEDTKYRGESDPEEDDSLFHCLGYAVAETIGIRNTEFGAREFNGPESPAPESTLPVGHVARLELRVEPGENKRVRDMMAELRANDNDGLLPWEKTMSGLYWLAQNEPAIYYGAKKDPEERKHFRMNQAHLDYGYPQAVIVTMRGKDD